MVRAVCVGKGRELDLGKRVVRTGHYKVPVEGPVEVGELGLAGDEIVDDEHHGGRDQAVYAYFGADLDWWQAELGESLQPGTFGENILVDGIEAEELALGDRLVMNVCVIELTAPRIPCSVFAGRMERPDFVKRFRDGMRPGVYGRVVQAGPVQAGESVQLVRGESGVRINDVYREWYRKPHDLDEVRRILACEHLAVRSRDRLEGYLKT